MTLASKRKLLGGSCAPLVVTGMGLVTPVGIGVAAFEQALRERRSALASLASIPGFDATDMGGLVGLKREGSPTPASARAAIALSEAIAAARLQAGRVGLYVGTALGDLTGDMGAALSSLDTDYRGLGARLADVVTRLAPGVHCAPPRIFSVTCVSSLCAFEQAAADLALGRVDAALVGGVDSLTRWMQAGFKALGALSPSGCLRPFHRDHDGILLGEAAAFIVVESMPTAVARGADVHACVASQSPVE